MAIRIFITGGTFDKEYNEITGQLYFKDTHLHELLEMGRCRVPVEIRTLMMIDSLEMTEEDKQKWEEFWVYFEKFWCSSPEFITT